MEGRLGLVGADDGDVVRQHGVERLGRPFRRWPAGDLDAGNLRERMDTRIRPAGHRELIDAREQDRQRGTKLALDGSPAWLRRPAAEPAAVVLDLEPGGQLAFRATTIEYSASIATDPSSAWLWRCTWASMSPASACCVSSSSC